MSLFLLDTDTLTLLQQGHSLVLMRVNRHLIIDIALSAITLQEQMQGWLAVLNRARNSQQTAVAYDMLVTRLLPMWGRFLVLPFTEQANLRFEGLKAQRLNVGFMDLRIAATALENNLIIVTRNRRDFARIPNLRIEDWSL